MRLFFTTLLYALLLQSLSAQQSAWSANEWAKGLARVERLKDNHERLPKSLYEEIKMLDSILNEICEKKIIEPPMRCEHARSKLSFIRNQLNKMALLHEPPREAGFPFPV
ncbi:MAG: hypothetical protein KIS77_18460 [Saprospiraceae bacterium]|nr:hypothetical protein [Saprospiraceae bacterium]